MRRRLNTCHVCKRGSLHLLSEYEGLERVSSDCRPLPAGGRLGLCERCGTVVKPIDDAWRREIDAIYRGYDIFHQGNGSEQAVFGPKTGQAQTRSSRLIEKLRHAVDLPNHGRLLDVGCGKGAFLEAFSLMSPSWSLCGTEQSDHTREHVEAIPNVDTFHVGSPEEIEGQFDLVSMIHVLEHVPDPVSTLRALTPKIRRSGGLFIEVPSFIDNPFDLVTADHCTHFTSESLRRLLEESGFEVVEISTRWISKELSAYARPARVVARRELTQEGLRSIAASVRGQLDWLLRTRSAAAVLSREPKLGLFGTSIGATWLSGTLDEGVAFFVDEDPNRIGRRFLSRPILPPGTVPADASVFFCLPHPQAKQVSRRLLQSGASWKAVLPPVV